MATSPKNCSPSLGGRLGFGGTDVKTASGPNAVEHARPEGAGVQRPGDELPERIEVGVGRARRVVVMRGGVVHVGGDEQDVADAAALEAVSSAATSCSRPSVRGSALAKPSCSGPSGTTTPIG
jgi:hypothetical protein